MTEEMKTLEEMAGWPEARVIQELARQVELLTASFRRASAERDQHKTTALAEKRRADEAIVTLKRIAPNGWSHIDGVGWVTDGQWKALVKLKPR